MCSEANMYKLEIYSINFFATFTFNSFTVFTTNRLVTRNCDFVFGVVNRGRCSWYVNLFNRCTRKYFLLVSKSFPCKFFVRSFICISINWNSALPLLRELLLGSCVSFNCCTEKYSFTIPAGILVYQRILLVYLELFAILCINFYLRYLEFCMVLCTHKWCSVSLLTKINNIEICWYIMRTLLCEYKFVGKSWNQP